MPLSPRRVLQAILTSERPIETVAAGFSASELAGAAALRKEELEIEEKSLDGRRSHLTIILKVLRQKMEEESVTRVAVEHELGKSTVFLEQVTYASCPAELQQELCQWLDDHGQGILAKRSVNAQTLKSHIRETMTEGGEVPPMVKVSVVPEVRVRRT